MSPLQCPLCNAKHWLSHCEEFKKKSLKDRFAFIHSKNICDNCLVPGHFSKFCPKGSFCHVTGCEVQAKHSSFLHPKPGRTIANPASGDGEASSIVAAQQVDNQQALNGFVRSRSEAIGLKIEHGQESTTALAILPVKVKTKGSDQVIQTYALLDNGLNASFISEELAEQLNLSGERTTLSLKTLERENSKTDCCVISLEVLDLNEENLIELPVVFTKQVYPSQQKALQVNRMSTSGLISPV